MMHAKKVAGFTLIEVMVAIGIVTVGAAGLMAMQTATMRATRDSRKITNAVAINQIWIERLERDAQSWRQRGSTGLLATEVFERDGGANQYHRLGGDRSRRWRALVCL